MARKVRVLMIDDLDGESTADQTVSFALDGISYEIDLSPTNAEQLRSHFAHWTAHARKVGHNNRRRTTPAPANTTDIRRWAARNGYTVADRGRIPATVRDAYLRATA
ncbi:histone-like nucleoid-structuring protein Lsr2 [Nocardia carnea]|uniref:histone-like nucleoid-structuring protein Lsr2 n=1 Tax=Nocardia carnea TaxID=37328 RepID=UPI00245747FA|nr:Lsr2 family protein [Nocardia carnea]